MTRTLLAAALLATAGFGFTAAAEASPYHHGHGYGYASVDELPTVTVVPERTGVYFKRDFVGAKLVVQQCYKQRAWTSEGELFWREVCQ